MQSKERIWLLGSGPTLVDTPWDLMKNEVTFAMNKIHLIYKYTDWRPSMYFKVDHNTVDLTHKEEIMIHAGLGIPMWLWDQFRTGYPEGHPNYDIMPDGVGELPNTTWIPRCKNSWAQARNRSKRCKGWHFPQLCTSWTGISTMIQIAVQLGYKSIYLLGCDLGYTPDARKNHFTPDYTKDLRDKSEMDNYNMLHAHKVADICSPVPIYNASPGGYLEVYPRVDMYEVLNGGS